MVNHFASLLSNLNLFELAQTAVSYELITDDNYEITTADGFIIDLADGYQRTLQLVQLVSPLINKNYTKIDLPLGLQRFYDLLFPETASLYFKQFLLYCYLRLVDATDIRNAIKEHDHRIAYDLDALKNYFKLNRVYMGDGNPADYKLLVFGKLKSSTDINSFSTKFAIEQIPNTQSVYIYSYTQKKYYKHGVNPSTASSGMESVLDSGGSTITKPVAIGDTGLSFSLVGSFQDFISDVGRVWTFTAEAPFSFNFFEKMQQLSSHYQIVETMLDFQRAECNTSYENLWHTHYNDVYRFVGLLLAYVERVELVWQQKQK